MCVEEISVIDLYGVITCRCYVYILLSMCVVFCYI